MKHPRLHRSTLDSLTASPFPPSLFRRHPGQVACALFGIVAVDLRHGPMLRTYVSLLVFPSPSTSSGTSFGPSDCCETTQACERTPRCGGA